LLAFAISLCSGLSWGISDFLGGLYSRRMHVLSVLAVSQPFGLLVALAALPLVGADSISGGEFAIAAAAGFASAAGLAAFYQAMAIGTISVVAPIAATGVLVPVAFGIADGEVPGLAALIGAALAVVGVVVLSYEEDESAGAGKASTRTSILLALISALGFGLFFTGIDAAAAERPGLAIVGARIGGVASIAVALVAIRPSLRPVGGALPALLAMGFFDVAANFLFALASTKGLLPLVAVGGSTYPAFTIALAHVLLGERLAPPQRVGVVLALAGVVAVAAGS
jgi:drug/metabolite transporter (DMT)-like permease